MNLWLLAADPDTERLRQLGIGGAIAVILVGMVLTFALRWRGAKADESARSVPSNGTAGDRSSAFWEKTNLEIAEKVSAVQTARLLGILKEMREERQRENAAVLDGLRRIEILLERRGRAR